MTREEIIKELEDIRSAIEYDGELVAEDSLDALADRLMNEGSEDVSEQELDTINEMIYGSFIDPETICVELINMLMSGKVKVDEDIDPFTDDIWDDEDIDWDAMAEEAEHAGKPNFAEFPDHHYQEGCEGKNCDESVEEKPLEEGHYGRDSIIDGDLPGKENGFLELIAMRFHNMGFDEDTHPLYPGAAEQMWNPFGEDSLVMFGDSPEFFQPIVDYIKSEVVREDSAWYNRDYEVCEVDDGYRREGAYALCIEARDYDRAAEAKFIPKRIQMEYARRRKMRRAAKKELAPV